MKQIERVNANPKNSLLIVIDMEKEPHFNGRMPLPPPFVEPNPEACTLKAIIPSIQGLLAKARDAGLPIIYVQSIRNHHEANMTVFGGSPRLKVGTSASEFFDELTPKPNDFVVRKWDHDPWFETDLERVLQGIVPDPTSCQALVTGGSILGCAFYGVMGFYVRNFQPVVVTDAVYGGPVTAMQYFSRTTYPTYPNVQFTRSDLINFSKTSA